MLKLIIKVSVFFLSLLNPFVYVGGDNILFELKTNGVMISGGYDLIIDNKIYNPLKDGILKKGDIITQIDEKEIKTIKELVDSLKYIKKGQNPLINVLRKNKNIKAELLVDFTNNEAKTGLYVKERVVGVGTLTYIDPESMYYMSLGHEVNEENVSLSSLKDGSIYASKVLQIEKSTKGNIGEKISSTSMETKLGSVKFNTLLGLGGIYEDKSFFSNRKKLEIASIKDIKIGKATFLTCTENNKIEEYELKINKISPHNELKGLHIEITDEYILKEYGGIYSGMSGSPIIQNNKIIGAITHVTTQNPKKGYGIFMENMYKKMTKEMNV